MQPPKVRIAQISTKKNIKNSVLFCSVLKLHYLCTRKENKYINNIKESKYDSFF